MQDTTALEVGIQRLFLYRQSLHSQKRQSCTLRATSLWQKRLRLTRVLLGRMLIKSLLLTAI